MNVNFKLTVVNRVAERFQRPNKPNLAQLREIIQSVLRLEDVPEGIELMKMSRDQWIKEMVELSQEYDVLAQDLIALIPPLTVVDEVELARSGVASLGGGPHGQVIEETAQSLGVPKEVFTASDKEVAEAEPPELLIVDEAIEDEEAFE